MEATALQKAIQNVLELANKDIFMDVLEDPEGADKEKYDDLYNFYKAIAELDKEFNKPLAQQLNEGMPIFEATIQGSIKRTKDENLICICGNPDCNLGHFVPKTAKNV